MIVKVRNRFYPARRPSLWITCFVTVLCAAAQAQTKSADDTATGPTATTTTKEGKAPSKKEVESDASKNGLTPDDTIVLTPFEVTTNNKGYMAANSASGTRLNSKLEDIASPISVVTKQQLTDMAAVDLNDIFRSESNVEGTYQYTELGFDRGNVVDTTSNNPESANRIRGIGQANITTGGMSTSSAIPIDIYNADSVEIARGANSNIFGIGSTSGTVNINVAAANTTRDSTSLTLRADSNEGTRENFSINRVIFKDKLAFRVDGVNEDKGFVREPSYDKTKRLNLAAKFQPFKKTTFKVSYETYRESGSLPNQLTPREGITSWENTGGYTWNASTATLYDNKGNAVGVYPGTLTSTGANNATTLYNNFNFQGPAIGGSAYQRPVIGYIDGQISYLTGTGSWILNRILSGNPQYLQYGDQRMVDYVIPAVRINVPTINPATGQPYGSITSALDQLTSIHGNAGKALYDWTEYNINASNHFKKAANTARYDFEQSVFTTDRQQFAVQASALYEDVENKSWNFVGNGGDGVQGILYIDPNRTLPNGDTNPGYLRPYIGSRQPQVYYRPEQNHTHRAQAAYVLDFTKDEGWTKWFGHHNFVGYGEYREKRNAPTALRYASRIADTSGLVRSTGNSDSLITRYYLGDGTGYNVDDPTRAPPSAGMVNYTYWQTQYGPTGSTILGPAQWTTQPVQLAETYFSGGTLKTENRTLGILWQGSLLNDRIVPTFGYRKDRVRFAANKPYTTQYRVGDINGNGVYTDPTTGLFDFSDAYQLVNNVTGSNENSGATKTRGVVVKVMPWLHFTYNKSDSYDPQGLAVDTFGRVVPNPTGLSEDMSLRFTLLKDRLWVSVNKYHSTTINARNGGANVLATRPLGYDFVVVNDVDTEFSAANTPNAKDLFHWYFWRIWGDTQAAANGQPGYNGSGDPVYMAKHGLTTAQQTADYIYDLMGISKDYVARNANLPGGVVRTATNDVTSKGYELEINYRTNNWNLKVTGAQKEAIDTNLASALTDYINQRLPYLQSATFTNSSTGITESFFDTTYSGSGTTTRRNAYYNEVLAQYEPLVANLGKSRPQVRKYSLALTTSYKLAGITENKYLKNVRVGGGGSWASRAAIGYGYAAPDFDPPTNTYVIRRLDPDKRFYDKSRYTLNAFAAYDFRMYSGRVKSSLQLNVQNLQEDGRLQPVAVNTDGTPWAYRIVDPRVFQLTWNLEL